MAEVTPEALAGDCPFCARIRAREYDDRNQWAVTFEPLNPVTPGHRLIVSACHARSALSDPVVSGATMEFAVQVAKRLGIGQCNFITSAGPAATQTVGHLHVHLVPRREGDGLALPWTAPAHAALTGQLAGALEDYQDLHDRLGAWPQCPDGCGCDLATGDPDAQECACDGPCTMECRENGYPDAPSYRDLAVNAERERIKGLFGTWIDIINPAGEPNSHPPEAWKTAFADLISDKPQFTLDAREALEGGHG